MPEGTGSFQAATYGEQGQLFLKQCELNESESRCLVHVFSLFRATLEVH